MDLIGRQATIDAIEQHKIAVLEGGEWDEGIAYGYAAAHRHLVEIVKRLPSAQPEIIRCKDCKYRDDDDFCTGRGYPNVLAPDDGFCDKGERRASDEWFC